MSESKPEKVNAAKVRGFKTKSATYELSSRNAILYALGLGYSSDPMNVKDLDFTYELAEDFKIFPTIGAVFYPLDLAFEALRDCPGMPDFNPMMLLHGEEMLKLYRPLKPDHVYQVQGIIEDIQDKSKGALVIVRISAYEDKELKNLAVDTICTLFIRGIGGFETNKNTKAETYVSIPKPPKMEPDAVLTQKTNPNQAILYRLSGDYNPLHIDPSMASMGGFNQPILHGLCSYGVIGKLLTEKYLNNDISKFESMAARFTSHVFPGETIVVKAWKMGEGSVIFSASTKERQQEIAVGEFKIRAMSPKL